jgi:hypothetical protein
MVFSLWFDLMSRNKNHWDKPEYVQVAWRSGCATCISWEFVFPPVGSLSSDRLLVSHETWFKGKTFSTITCQWTERCQHECTERCMLLAAFRSQRARGAVLFTDECVSTGGCILETLSFGLRRTPIFTKSWRETHLTLCCGLDWVQHTCLALSSFAAPLLDRLTTTCLANGWYHNCNKWGSKTLLSCNLMEHHHTLPCTRDYLNETFPGWWIGRGSGASTAPFAWPPRSPDLTTPDSALWGFIRERVGKMQYRTTEVLRAAVKEAFTHVTPDYLRKTSARTWRRIQLCYDNEGLHTDVLNSEAIRYMPISSTQPLQCRK